MWEEVPVHSMNTKNTPQLWGITLVSMNDGGQYFAYDPSIRSQWMLTINGDTLAWSSYTLNGSPLQCSIPVVEEQMPLDLITHNRNSNPIPRRGVLRGQKNLRGVVAQRTKPTTLLLTTKGRGECVFSYGAMIFHIDGDAWNPYLYKLPIVGLATSRNIDTSSFGQVRRKWAACVCFGHSLLYHGGALVNVKDTEQHSLLVDNLYFLYDFSSEKWEQKQLPGKGRAMHTATKCGNRIFIIGGITMDGLSDSIEIFNCKTMEWEPSITIEEKFYGHNAVVYCSKILIYGGITKKNGLTEFVNPNQLFYFDTVHDIWDSIFIEGPTIPRFGHQIIINNDKLYIQGGMTKSGITPSQFTLLKLQNIVLLNTGISTFPNDIHSMLNAPQFSDRQIKLHGKDIKLHNFILAARAPKFLRKIEEGFDFSNLEYSLELCEQALQLIYSDYCQVSLQFQKKFESLLLDWGIERAQLIQNIDEDQNDNADDLLSPLYRDMKISFASSLYYDVSFTFPSNDIILHAHKELLATRSEYFRAMFSFNPELTMVPITTTDYPIFSLILEYISTDSCNINTDNVIELLEASDLYSITRLKLQCSHLISQHLEESTIVAIWEKSKKHNCPQLESNCLDFLIQFSKQKGGPHRIPEFTYLPIDCQQELQLFCMQ